MEVFAQMVLQYATTDQRAADIIAQAEQSLPSLTLGGITALPDGTRCITIHRVMDTQFSPW